MKTFCFILALTFSLPLLSQNVGIGTATPHPSAALEISDGSKGLLIPRGDTANISTPATGLMVYQISDSEFYQFNGTTWQLLGVVDKIEDKDKDTRVEVEENPDEDIIRFYTEGTEVMRQSGNTLEMLNNGKSVFIGEEAGLQDDLLNNNNVFVGYRAGKENITGVNNVAIGEQALQNSLAGNNNVAIGKQAMSLNTGNNNVGIGLNALQKNSSGEKNTAIGGFAGFANQTGDHNTLIGYEAGRGTNLNQSGNVMIGHQAGKNETENDKLYIANSETTSPLIYGNFAQKKLTINDELEVSDHLSVGAITGTQREAAEVAGAIQIGNAETDTPALDDAGTIRWNETESDYEGWDGAQWRSMTMLNEEIDCEIGIEIDTLPFVITEPGFYYLTKNLELNVTSVDGIRIDLSDENVTIDLNGFALIGPGYTGSFGAGIKITDITGWIPITLTIKDGIIRDWNSSAVSNEGDQFSIVHMFGIELSNNGIGVNSRGPNGVFIDCLAKENVFYGFKLRSGNRLEGCVSESNGINGFDGKDDNLFINCKAFDNNSIGFNLESHNILKSCSASNNNDIGFDLKDENILINCRATINHDFGFVSQDNGFVLGDHNMIKGCYSGTGSGFGIVCDDYNSIENCVVTRNDSTGIVVRNFNKVVSNQISFNNTDEGLNHFGLRVNIANKVVGNLIADNFGIGIKVDNHRNLLDDNDVFNTRTAGSALGVGFIFDSTNNAWRNNTGTGNTGSNVGTLEPPASRSFNNFMY